MSGDAHDFDNIETRDFISFFFPYKARRQRKFTPFWQKQGNMHHRMPLSKTGWPILNVVIFPPMLRLVLADPKQWPHGDYWSNSRANLGINIYIWATGHLTWTGCVHHSRRFGHAEAPREVGPKMLERGSKTSTVPVVWATFVIFSARSKWFPVGRDCWPWTKPGYITMTRRQSNN